MKRIIYSFVSACLLLSSCSMDEIPQASVDKDTVFRTEKGLETYSYSFYNMLPSVSDGFRQDAMCDYGAVTSFDNFIREGAYSAELSSGWSWSDLRNINYFIENCTNEAVDESVRNNYIGQARFFRAYFYYEMVVRFGDVPWIDRTLGVDDELLYAGRDSRTTVMDHVLEDLDFACENISRTKDETGSLVTKWVAYALKSRICLFEASFRKYHTELGLTDSVDEWYQEAVRAAETVMKESGHSIYTGEGTDASFRSLFISDKPVTSEVMLASCADAGLAVLGEANWWWTSGTYGARFSMIRTFVNTFLNTDGTPFTDRAGYETMEFYDECQNRDARLAQTIRTPGYERDGAPAAPNFNGYSYTGYQPIKYTLDDTKYDAGALNTNAIPLFRYAEVLLNYAEAKAELGTLTDADWANTVGVLRARAGITGGLSAKPTKVDAYFQQNYFPNISDPVILEVRRERSIELALEGFRFTDLKRWKRGELMTMRWTGIYVPALNVQMDLDKDGTPDVIFYKGEKPTGLPASCTPVSVGEGTQQGLTGATSGNLTWSDNDPRVWYDDGRQYYYPIPQSAINNATLPDGTTNLKQNPGW
ncbi:RagB/SusD family nutrient uptake outer membrane protein [Parabacteroides johnsonii]|uniref:RagB/SusD family nutrient uptake outer membrane protein n=1 Tax=Parabacteroides johnsonii TaxID=387661 RepID=UPI0022E168D7|nr:RagB/SusD family nutrient uptake outer membrane protein [Parabacteroides johnsonii]